MIRVMVVKDEPPIQRNICQRIVELNPNFEITATADNGKDAIAWLPCHKVDVFSMDINLPVVNDLGALDYTAEDGTHVIPVVPSGYRNSEYAKRAFISHVIDYLLEPLKEKESKALLQRTESIYRRSRFEESVQELEEILDGGRAGAKDKTERDSAYRMMLLISGSSHGGSVVSELSASEIYQDMNLEEAITSMISRETFWIIGGRQVNEKLTFIRRNRELPIDKLNRIPRALERRKFPVTVAYSEEPVRLQETNSIYRQMRDYAREHMIFAKDAVLMFCRNNLKPESWGQKKKIDQMIYHCRRDPNADTVFREFKRLLALVAKRPVRYKDVVYALRYFMSRLCGGLPGRREYFELKDSLQSIFDNFYSADEIETEFRLLVKEVFDTAQRGYRDKKQLADEVKAYLDANYRKNIASRALSEQLEFVTSYLSSIFEEYYRLTPNGYMTRKRIETARYFLANENGKIKDVVIMIGYEDLLYLSRVFKRYFEMSPREYTGHIEVPKS